MRMTDPPPYGPPLSPSRTAEPHHPPHAARPAGLWVRRAAVCAVVAAPLLLVTMRPAHAAATQVALAGSVDQVLDNIRNWLMGILAALATVFLTIGGVRYVMAAGNPGEVEKAKTAFKSAGIGYALAALAPLVVTVLKGIVGA